MEMMAEVVMAESGIAIANKASAQKSIKQKEYNTKWYQKQTSSQINERNKNKKLKMACFRIDLCHECRRRRFTVRARNGNTMTEAHQLSEHLSTTYNRDT